MVGRLRRFFRGKRRTPALLEGLPPPPPPPAIRPNAPPPPPPQAMRPRVQLLFEDGTVVDAAVEEPLRSRIETLAGGLWPRAARPAAAPDFSPPAQGR